MFKDWSAFCAVHFPTEHLSEADLLAEHASLAPVESDFDCGHENDTISLTNRIADHIAYLEWRERERA